MTRVAANRFDLIVPESLLTSPRMPQILAQTFKKKLIGKIEFYLVRSFYLVMSKYTLGKITFEAIVECNN